MKLNEFVCPNCQHRWFKDAAYGTCDQCRTFFYLSERAAGVTCFVNGVPLEQWLQGQYSNTAGGSRQW